MGTNVNMYSSITGTMFNVFLVTWIINRDFPGKCTLSPILQISQDPDFICGRSFRQVIPPSLLFCT